MAAAYAIGIDRARRHVDMGGGSTEVTLGTAARMECGRSFKLGAIRLAERFGQRDPLSERDESRLVRHIVREAADILSNCAGGDSRASSARPARSRRWARWRRRARPP